MRPILRLLATSCLAAAAACALSGCQSFFNKFTADSTANALKVGSGAIDSEGDPQFVREAIPASLKTVETFLYSSPENKILLETLAQGYSQYAFGFLEDDLESLGENDEDAKAKLEGRATYFYDRAFDFGIRLAALEERRITEAVKGGVDGLQQVLKKGDFDDEEDGKGIYWAGLSMGSAINLNKNDMGRVADLPKAVALLERAHDIAPNYFNHGAALSLGVVYASQGKAMGGDPDRSKKMFEEVIGGTGGKYLMAKVLYARYYATVVQDRALFEKTLNEVIATSPSVWPEQRLANTLAIRRAKRYLAQADDLFLPPEPAGATKEKGKE